MIYSDNRLDISYRSVIASDKNHKGKQYRDPYNWEFGHFEKLWL